MPEPLGENRSAILRPSMPDIAVVSKKVYAVDAPPENARKPKTPFLSLHKGPFLCFTLLRILHLPPLCSLLLRILHLLRLSIRPLDIKSSLGLRMLLTQLLLLDKRTHHQPHSSKTHIHDPHGMQTLRECRLRDLLLSRGQIIHQLDISACTSSCELGGGLGA